MSVCCLVGWSVWNNLQRSYRNTCSLVLSLGKDLSGLFHPAKPGGGAWPERPRSGGHNSGFLYGCLNQLCIPALSFCLTRNSFEHPEFQKIPTLKRAMGAYWIYCLIWQTWLAHSSVFLSLQDNVWGLLYFTFKRQKDNNRATHF